jgi:hypothetical protein
MTGICRATLRSFAGLAVVLALGGPADAHKLRILHSFCQEANCADSGGVMSLSRDTEGNLYGTAGTGATDYGSTIDYGSHGGTIFELTHNADGSKWRYGNVHKFTHDR